MALRVAVVLALFTVVITLASKPARAHPHVWVTAHTEILYDDSERIAGLRHIWTFDEFYSAWAVQGLEEDYGEVGPEQLRELAEINATSLVEFGYFTEARIDGGDREFAPPVDFDMIYEDGHLTLTFTLPLNEPARPSTAFVMEIYDPTFFVSFTIDKGDDAIRLVGGPQGCAKTITRPASSEIEEAASLSEAFFATLTAASDFGEQFANRALIACP
ncbi:MAG: DUF1007 family protein [Salinarimonas sp.]|nr:DUF1007 family protein [Salinarimonas sp.]